MNMSLTLQKHPSFLDSPTISKRRHNALQKKPTWGSQIGLKEAIALKSQSIGFSPLPQIQ